MSNFVAADLSDAQQDALEQMRGTFKDENGHGMPMNDDTFLRYLRARFVYICTIC